MKENEILRSFDQLACAFPKKIFEDKVKSESFDRLVKTNQPNWNKNDTMKQRIAVYYSLPIVDPCQESTQMNTKLIYNWIAVDHLRWSTQTQEKKSVQENYNCGTPK